MSPPQCLFSLLPWVDTVMMQLLGMVMPKAGCWQKTNTTEAYFPRCHFFFSQVNRQVVDTRAPDRDVCGCAQACLIQLHVEFMTLREVAFKVFSPHLLWAAYLRVFIPTEAKGFCMNICLFVLFGEMLLNAVSISIMFSHLSLFHHIKKGCQCSKLISIIKKIKIK